MREYEYECGQCENKSRVRKKRRERERWDTAGSEKRRSRQARTAGDL